MRCMGETHDEGENGHPFFLVYIHRVVDKANQRFCKKTFMVGTRPGRALGTMIATFSERTNERLPLVTLRKNMIHCQ